MLNTVRSRKLNGQNGGASHLSGCELSWEDLAKLSEKYVHPRGHHLTAIVKLNVGLISDVTDEDIEAVFDFLDEDGSGSLEVAELSKLLKNALTPPCTDSDVVKILESMGKTTTDEISMPDLKHAMHSGVLEQALKRLHRERDQEIRRQAEIAAAGPQITRSLFTDRIGWRVSRDDSFYTLPFTIIFIVVFIAVVVSHLQIFKRQKVQQAMEEWVQGFGETYHGPYQEDHVGNKQQMLEWVNQSGLPLLFSFCQDSSRGHQCQVAPRSVLVGDVRLIQNAPDDSEQSRWLLHSPEAQAHLALRPLDYQTAARKRLVALWDWIDDDTEQLQLVFTTYFAAVETFAVTKASLYIGLDGVAVEDCICRAININPYSSWDLYVVESVYLLLVLYSASLEAKQLCIRGCFGYWDHGGMEGVWNAVDLFGVVMGIANIVQWILFVMLAHSDDIHGLLREDDGFYLLVNDAMSIPVSDIENLESRLRAGSTSVFIMQIAMGTNVLSIMMKLFKAFGANARLQLVTGTLSHCSVDMFHFGVVFAAIFMAFALIAHILFGEDITEFRSFPLSLNTLFETLLGDFDWFSDRVVSTKDSGSGLPFGVVVAWYYAFMIFVVLVMMNMMLAIIMDHYMNLLGHVKSDPDNAPTLWEQTSRMYKRWKHSKGCVDNARILHQMVDAKPPVHPENIITKSSLEKAFPQMPQKQVAMLISWMTKEAEKRRLEKAEPPKAEDIRLLHEIQSDITGLTDQIRIVTHAVCENFEVMNVLEMKFEAFLKEKIAAKEAKNFQLIQDSAATESPARCKAHTDLPRLIEQVKDYVEKRNEGVAPMSLVAQVRVLR